MWAIENDDFDGKSCGKHKYPLMRIIGGCLIDNEGWVQMCATTVDPEREEGRGEGSRGAGGG